MSTSIDKKVVEMQFKNEQFEQGAKTSMSTIDKLKSKLNFDSCSDGLKKLGKSVNSFSMGSLESNISAISDRFSSMGIIGMTALQRITNAAIDTGKNLVSSLTIAPISQGFGEYELEMNSVQTIMAGTGESLETVMKYLDELNTYADMTIYSFSDMTSNIGKFTNMGISLDKAVAAIKGISNEAAVSGANATEASRAMYNFSQALSAGYVKLIDWKSIENANMATKEFKQELIDTAVSLGTLTKEADGTYKTLKGNSMSALSNFNDTLQDQWMTTDVLVDTLNRYADATTTIGKKAYAAASDVKTFTQLMDTLKEAAGSGWARTFNIIIGDFNEAKELFTSLSDTFGDLIQKMADSRNNLLEGALGKASSLVNDNFHKAYDAALTARAGVISEETWNTLNDLGYASETLQKKLLDAAASAGVLEQSEDGLYNTGSKLIGVNNGFVESLSDGWLTSSMVCDVLNDIGETQAELASNTEEAKKTLSTFQDEILETARKHGVAYDEMKSAEENFQNILQNGLLTNDIIDEVISNLESGLANAQASVDDLSDATFKCGMTFQQVSDLAMDVWRGNWGNGQPRYDALTAAGYDWETVQSYVDFLVRGGEASDYYWYSQLNLSDAVKENIDYTSDQVEALKALKQQAEANGMTIEEYISIMTRPTGRQLLIESFENIYKNLSKIFSSIRDGFRDIFPKSGSEMLYQVISKFHDLTEKLIISDQTAENLKDTFRGVFAVLDILIQPIEFIAKLVGKLAGATLPDVGSNLLKITGRIGKLIDKFRTLIKKSEIWEKALDTISSLLTPIIDVLKTVFDLITDVIAALIDFANGEYNSLKSAIDGTTQSLDKQSKVLMVFKTIGNVFYTIGKAIATFIGWVVNGIKTIWNLEPVQSFIHRFADAFVNSFDNMKGILSSMGTPIDEFKSHIEELNGISLDNIGSAIKYFFQDIVANFFLSLGTALKPVGEAIAQTFNDIKNAVTDFAKANPIFQKIIDFLSPLGESISNMFNKTGSINVTSFTNALGSVKDAFSGFGTAMSNTGKNLPNVMTKLYEFLRDNLAGFALIFIGFAEFKEMGKLNSTINNFVNAFTGLAAGINNILSAVSGAIKKFSEIEEAVATNLKAQTFKIIATSITELIACIIVLTFIDQDKIWNAVGVLAAVAGILAGLTFVFYQMAKDSNTSIKDIIKLGTVLQSFAAAILIMAIALRIMDGVKNVVQDLVIFAAMLAGMIIVAKRMSKNTRDLAASSGALISFAASLLILSIALKVISSIKAEDLVKSIFAITILIGEMLGCYVVISKMPSNSSKSALVIVGFAAALILIAQSLAILSLINTESLFIGITAITLLLIELSVIMVLSQHAGENAVKAGVMIAAIGIALLSISQAIFIIGSMKLGSIIKGVAALTIIMYEIGILLQQSANIGRETHKSIALLIGVAAALLIIAGAVFILGNLPLGTLAKGTVAVSALMFMLSLMLTCCDSVKVESYKSFVVLAAIILIVVGSVIVLSQLDPAQIYPAVVAMDSMLLCIAALLLASKYAKGLSYSDIGKLAIVAGMASAMVLLATLLGRIPSNSEQVLQLCTGMTEIMLAFTAAIAVMSKLNIGVVEAVKMSAGLSAGIAIIIGTITGIAAALGAINELTNGAASSFIEGGMEILSTVFNGIGKAIGSFVGGIGEGLSASAPVIADNMSQFAYNIKPFFDVMQGVDDDIVSKVLILVAAIQALTGSSFLDMISSWFGGGVANFGTDIASFGSSLKTFLKSISSLTEDDVKKVNLAAQACESLSNVEKNLKSRSGLMGLIFGGSQSLAEFGASFKKFGDFLVEFCGAISTLTDDDLGQISKAAEAASKMVELANNLPKSGGFLQDLVGSAEIDEWGTKLASFGKSLVTLRDNLKNATGDGENPLTDEDLERIKSLSSFIDPLVELSNKIPNSGGFLSFLVGDNNIDDFGDRLSKFGTGIAGYVNAVKGVTVGKRHNDITVVASDLVDIANKIQGSTGFIDFFCGGQNRLTAFGNQLKSFGTGLKDFSDSIKGITKDNATKMGAVATAAKPLIEVGNLITDIDGGWFGSNFGNISKFGDNMKAFGTGLKNFWDEAKGISSEVNSKAINSVIESISSVGDCTDSIGKISDIGDKADTFKEVLRELGTAIYAYYLKIKSINDSIDITIATTILTDLTTLKDVVTTMCKIFDSEDADKKLPEFSEKMGYVGDGVYTFYDKLKGVESTLSVEAIKAIASSIFNVSEQQNAINKISEMSDLDNFVTNIGTIANGLAAYYGKMKEISSEDGLISNVSTVSNDMDTITSVVTKINELGDTTGFSTNLTTIAGAIKTAVQSLTTAFSGEGCSIDNFNLAVTALWRVPNVLNAFSEVDTVSVINVVKALNDLTSWVSTLSGVDTENISSFVDELGEVATNALTNFFTKFENCQEEAETAASIFINVFNSCVQINLTQVEDKGKELATKLKDGAVANKSQADSAAISLISSFCTTINGYYSNAYDSGYYIASGLAQGLKSTNANQAVTDAAKMLGENAMTALKNATGVSSPSKIAIEYGKYIDEGLMIGLNSFSNRVEKASSMVGNNAMAALSNPFSTVSDIINSDYTSPVITPVLDLSMVQTGFASLDTMLTQRQAMIVSADISGSENSKSIVNELRSLVNIGNSILTSIDEGSDIYLNENTIIGRINRRLGSI